MKCPLCLFLVLLAIGLPSHYSFAQKKLVIMGSSTAAGTGASTYDSAWAGRIANFYRQNMADGLDTITYNIAIGGMVTYNEMHTGYVAPPNRPNPPDPARNVTMALSYNPDVVIINLPTNDIANGYSKNEYMNNLRTMYQYIINAGKRCYITTTQPRSSLSPNLRDSLRTLVDSINNNFGIYAINFWTDVATTDGQNNIKPEANSGDNIHVNNLGHNYFFQRVRDKQIFSFAAPLPLTLKDFRANLQNNSVILNWRTEHEEANTYFDVQRSGDGVNFSSLGRLMGHSNQTIANYSWMDQNPLTGKNFYRLKMIEPTSTRYSGVVLIQNVNREVLINKIYSPNSSTLAVEIQIQRSQPVLFRIINSAGTVIQQQSELITAPVSTINLSMEKLPSGPYFLRVDVADNYSIKAFKK